MSNEFMRLQIGLKRAGIDPGPTDGDPGPKTYQACIEYVAGGVRSLATPLARAMAADFPKYQIDQKVCRIAHFLGQAACETMFFARFIEMGSGKDLNHNGEDDYFERYDGRQDLGNTHPGDGGKYRGRGIFEITGWWNYWRSGKRIGIDLLANPERAAEPEISVLLACMFWSDKGLNTYADANDSPAVTKKINGGQNGLAVRQAATDKILKLVA